MCFGRTPPNLAALNAAPSPHPETIVRLCGGCSLEQGGGLPPAGTPRLAPHRSAPPHALWGPAPADHPQRVGLPPRRPGRMRQGAPGGAVPHCWRWRDGRAAAAVRLRGLRRASRHPSVSHAPLPSPVLCCALPWEYRWSRRRGGGLPTSLNPNLTPSLSQGEGCGPLNPA